MLFSDKAWGWKVLGTLALVAALGLLAHVRGQRVNPPVWRCLAQPARWDGAQLRLARVAVVEASEAGYVVQADRARIAVDGPPPPAGSTIELRARFRADRLRLEALSVRVVDPRLDRRWVVEAVSLAVLAAVLANLARHFRLRPSVLQAKGAP